MTVILSQGGALSSRHGKLIATDSSEAQQLANLIAETGRADTTDNSPRRMLVGRSDHRNCKLVTIFLLRGMAGSDEHATVVARIVDLFNQPSSGGDLAELFGLSPAENRLVQALIHGRTLQEMTNDFGLRMPTLRAQMRSIFRKCGVQRQVDLMRVLLRVR